MEGLVSGANLPFVSGSEKNCGPLVGVLFELGKIWKKKVRQDGQLIRQWKKTQFEDVFLTEHGGFSSQSC